MTEDAQRAAFEIKASCDEISRILLRWHWEQKPGSHKFHSLIQHIGRREAEDPEYYSGLPDVSRKTDWEQLDTTICMRVLTDKEENASKSLDLLGDTPRPGAARQACHTVRNARNEAAHATDDEGAKQAALLFRDAVEALENGYAGTALSTGELETYYRMAEEFLALTEAKPSRKRKASNKRGGSGSSGREQASKQVQRKKKKQSRDRRVLAVLLLFAAVGLLIRAWSMGLLG